MKKTFFFKILLLVIGIFLNKRPSKTIVFFVGALILLLGAVFIDCSGHKPESSPKEKDAHAWLNSKLCLFNCEAVAETETSLVYGPFQAPDCRPIENHDECLENWAACFYEIPVSNSEYVPSTKSKQYTKNYETSTRLLKLMIRRVNNSHQTPYGLVSLPRRY